MAKPKTVKTKAHKKRKPDLVMATKEELTPNYTEADYKEFIDINISKPRKTTRINYARITNSYWRITFWGKVDPQNIFSGDKILESRFLRIDIDSIGRMKYNDVTDGQAL